MVTPRWSRVVSPAAISRPSQCRLQRGRWRPLTFDMPVALSHSPSHAARMCEQLCEVRLELLLLLTQLAEQYWRGPALLLPALGRALASPRLRACLEPSHLQTQLQPASRRAMSHESSEGELVEKTLQLLAKCPPGMVQAKHVVPD